ncbi:MAG: DUF4340 domain-containing protein [Bacteroidia bacterium]|nr:DUF4340 domain-containing protein [Bacteroidia bacterium]
MNIKTLLGVLGILLIVVVVIKIYDSKKGEKTFKSELAVIDTANVSSITFFPKAEKKGIKLVRQGKDWKLQSNGKEFKADMQMVSALLNSIAVIKAERVAATDKSRWIEFEVTDTAGTRVQVDVKNKTVAEFIVGKFSYKQSDYGFKMFYYVRLAGENEVYSVQGQLTMMLNRDLNSFRDKTIIKDKKNLNKLNSAYPGDSLKNVVAQP